AYFCNFFHFYKNAFYLTTLPHFLQYSTYLLFSGHLFDCMQRFIAMPPCLCTPKSAAFRFFPCRARFTGQMTRSTAALYQCTAQKGTWAVVYGKDAVKQYEFMSETLFIKLFVFKILI